MKIKYVRWFDENNNELAVTNFGPPITYNDGIWIRASLTPPPKCLKISKAEVLYEDLSLCKIFSGGEIVPGIEIGVSIQTSSYKT